MNFNKLIYIGFIILLSLTNPTYAQQPIENFQIVNDFPTSIIGGNIYNLTVTYDSLDLDAIYNFTLLSPYLLLNNTPELKNYSIFTDDISLQVQKLHDGSRLNVYSHYHLMDMDNHETIVYFMLSPNIKPGNYSFEFNIIVDNVPIGTVKSQHSSSSSRSYIPSIIKTCTFKVVQKKENVTVKIVQEELDSFYQDDYELPIYNKNDTFANETQNQTRINETDRIIEDGNRLTKNMKIFLIVFIVVGCVVFYWWDEIVILVKKNKR